MVLIFHLAKLAKRLARLGGAATCLAAVAACAEDAAPLAPPPDDPPPAGGSVASLILTPSADSLPVGVTVRFTATVYDTAGIVVTDRAVVWSTGDAATAWVNATGAVTGGAPGTTSVTAESEGRRGTATIIVTPAPVPRPGYHAAESGTPAGDGSMDRPWDLATALAGGNGRVRPGDTIWVRGGTYDGAFTSTLQGGSGTPIVVRAVPGERAVIDGAGTTTSTFVVSGDWTVFWGLEFTNSDPVRVSTSAAHDARPNTVVNDASNVRYIHLNIHDGGTAFYNYPERGDVEITGCIFYNNGWQAPTRADGHALYLKSYGGPVVARDNVMFNQFGYGVHAYTNAGSGRLINIRLEGNIAFNNGTLATTQTSSNLLVGGADYATGDVLEGNFTYFSPGVREINVEVGYRSLANGDVVVARNHFVGGNPVLRVGVWDRVTFDANVLVGDAELVELTDTTVAEYTWGTTQHYRDPLSRSWTFAGASYPWLVWRTVTGLGLSDLATGGSPVVPEVFVRPSPYEVGRATLVVYNWTGQGAVAVDLSGVLAAGDAYEVRNVQDLFGPPVTTGTYGGAVTLPLGGVAPPVPIGMAASPAPRTGPAFDVFIVAKR